MPPCLKGRGPFIAGGGWITTSYLFLYPEAIYMTSGFRLEEVSLLRSVGGFYDVQACSGVFQAPSYYSSGPPHQWGERCPERFLEMLLSDVFA
jgi:hypothetical protein